MSSINNTMSAFIFNDDVANSIATAINGTPKTAREIAKELGVDEHIINQHLYQMRDVVKTDDRVLILSLPENEDEEFKEDYDDHGVLCRYTEKDGWFPIEEHCVECGYKDCECEEEEEEHECDEDDCEKCRRGKYCDCADNRCPYCSVKMGFK